MRLAMTAIAIAGVVGVVYLAGCLVWPFTACAKCEGAGKHRSPSGRAWRTCRRCKGSGGRLRVGRRVVNYLWRRRA